MPTIAASATADGAWFTFTVETYQHVLPGMGADAARVFEALIAPAIENPALRKAS